MENASCMHYVCDWEFVMDLKKNSTYTKQSVTINFHHASQVLLVRLVINGKCFSGYKANHK